MMVKIETPNYSDGPNTGRGTKTTTDSGAPIEGIRNIVVRISANKAITAEIECFSSFKGDAVAEFYVTNPISGDLRKVKRIEFADGSVFEGV
jgi:hypothetical protein